MLPRSRPSRGSFSLRPVTRPNSLAMYAATGRCRKPSHTHSRRDWADLHAMIQPRVLLRHPCLGQHVQPSKSVRSGAFATRRWHFSEHSLETQMYSPRSHRHMTLQPRCVRQSCCSCTFAKSSNASPKQWVCCLNAGRECVVCFQKTHSHVEILRCRVVHNDRAGTLLRINLPVFRELTADALRLK